MNLSEPEQRQLNRRIGQNAVLLGTLSIIELVFVSLMLVNAIFKLFSRPSFLPTFLDTMQIPVNGFLLGSSMLLLWHMLTLQGRRKDIPEQKLASLAAAQGMTAMAGMLFIAYAVASLLFLWLPWYVALPVTILAALGVMWRFPSLIARRMPESRA